ncbi:EF-P beta-lysylation protein EpmB [Balneatrix alpica]|uniref:L-lysine 2,3-aminomutase n=1 Tax=Balneatrix alpica TaxID=75684 RepID=A0ABV5ZB47_9GAMM|nr:EF-P beta-lysylation protein EpmB [Balneatrix alpica]
MITQSLSNGQPLPLIDQPSSRWQEEMRTVIRQPAELLQLLQLDPGLLPAAEQAARLFPLRVPRPYLQRMQPGNPQDPLLLQVLPLGLELQSVPGFASDPLEEANSNPLPGLIHKYASRVLLIANGACAINCRYCFRRHFPYEDNNPSRAEWQPILDYIQAHPEVNEVILSGGDPLANSDSRLAALITALEALPQLSRLRIHSRLPVVIPSRVTPELVQILGQSRLKVVLVSHINHPQEIDAEVCTQLSKLRQAGVHLLNQAVLLKGINDQLSTQVALAEALFAADILPYYLFVLDNVAGAAHFAISDSQAEQLHLQLQQKLPGFLVAKLAREVPGRPHKTLLPSSPWLSP